MAVNKVVELDNVGSVELQYVSAGLLKFIYGSPEDQTNWTHPVRYLLSDRRLKDISGYLEPACTSWDNRRYLFNQASEAFEEIERILAERKRQNH